MNVSKDAELYSYANTDESVIDTADTFHALQYLTEGLREGWTFAAGTRGTDITAMVTQDAGAATLITTTADHNLAVGDFVTITGTANYDSPAEVLTVPTSKTFKVNLPYVANDATGTYSRGDSFIADSSSAGVYDFTWGMSATPAAINKQISGAIMINDTLCEKCRGREYFTKAQDENVNGGAHIIVANGDHVCIVFKNISDTTNFTIRHANFRISRIRVT